MKYIIIGGDSMSAEIIAALDQIKQSGVEISTIDAIIPEIDDRPRELFNKIADLQIESLLRLEQRPEDLVVCEENYGPAKKPKQPSRVYSPNGERERMRRLKKKKS